MTSPPTRPRAWRSSTARRSMWRTMGCGDECPLVIAGRREDWQIPDPREMSPEEFRGVRDLIEAKVRELLAALDIPTER